jgi:predicted RNase H-like HicB family nuclease
MKRKLTASIWKEGDWYVAQCAEIDVASQGRSEDEALQNLCEALELHLEPPHATIFPQLRQIEIEVCAA